MKKNLKEALSIDKEAFGVSALFISVTERAKKDLLNSLILALIVQLIVLSITFRSPLLVGLAMSPVITATLFTASFCPMIGIKAHYINVGAFAIIVGLSEDYGINMVYRLKEVESYGI
jgi:predicted RND superfamily exporter protein